MSCGTCPESGQFSAQTSALSGGQVMLGWAVDVEQWFRERQACGQTPQPVRVTPVATAAHDADEPPLGNTDPAAAGSPLLQSADKFVRTVGLLQGYTGLFRHPGAKRATLLSISSWLQRADDVVCYAYAAGGGRSQVALVIRSGAHVFRLTADPDQAQGVRVPMDRNFRSIQDAAEELARCQNRRGARFYCLGCGGQFSHRLAARGLCDRCLGTHP